ncbi:hypothetical protein [Streptomyces canus]|uniref:hypothetical protein n=1 Tax=Streptomyces canus TaxID=58343 RepID=UPI0030DFDC89
MSNKITVAEQLRAVDLSNRCTRLLSLDMIWTGRMARAGHDDFSFEELAHVAREMATEIMGIRDELPFVREFAEHVSQEMDSISTDLVKSLGRIADDMADYITTYGPKEADELLLKADVLVKGGVPDGDLPRRLWGAVSAVGGVLTIAGGAACVVVLGPAGLPILTAAGMVGGPLLGAGVGVLLEDKEQKKRADEEEKRLAEEAEEREERVRKEVEKSKKKARKKKDDE